MSSTEALLKVQVRFFASARAAVGAESASLSLEDGASVADAVEALRRAYPEKLPKVLDAASFLLDGVAVRNRSITVHDGAELDVLPPFAGG